MKNNFLRTFSNASLATKLVSAFLAVSVISLGALTYLNIRFTQTSLTDSENEKLHGAAQSTAAEIDNFVQSNIDAVRTEAQMRDVLDYMELSTFQRAGSPEEIRLQAFFLALTRRDSIFIKSISLINTRGITLYDTYTPSINTNQSNHLYFQDVLKTTLPIASDVEIDLSTGEPSIYFASPVHDSSGKIVAILTKRYNASILQKIISGNNALVGSTSFPILLDANHVRLAHGTRPELNFKSIVPLDAQLLKDLQAQLKLPAGSSEELSTNLPEFEAGMDGFDSDGTQFFAAELQVGLQQAAVAKMTNLPWFVVFTQAQSEFLAPINTQVRNSLLLSSLIGFIAALVGLIISRSLTGPILRLTQTAESIAGGDLTIQAKVETGDEIGTLANAFNKMTSQLQELIGSLEQRVADRTKALSSVAEVGTAASTILETDKLLQRVVDLTKERFYFYHAHIYLLDETGKNLVLASGAGEPGRKMVAEGRSIPLEREQSLVARAARERKGVTVNDVTNEPDFLPNPLLPDTHSELAVPMIVGENVIGVFDVQSEVIGRFTDADIAVQTTLASQVASALQNARLYTQVEASSQEARSLIDNAPEAIIIVDLETGFFANPNENAVKLYGLPREELIKVGPGQMSPPSQPDGRDSAEKAMEKIGEAMQGGSPIFEWMHRNGQGEDFMCEIRLVRIPGARPRVRASVTDISERKRNENFTRQRAQQQEALNLITQKIQSATTIESALQLTARELGRALGMKPTLVTLEPDSANGEHKSDS